MAEPSAVDLAASKTLEAQDWPTRLVDLVAIARPDHWFKNIFMLPGAALALVLANDAFPHEIGSLLLALVSTCLQHQAVADQGSPVSRCPLGIG